MYHLLKPNGRIVLSFQPRWIKYEEEISLLAAILHEQYQLAGFKDVEIGYKLMKPVTSVHVSGRNFNLINKTPAWIKLIIKKPFCTFISRQNNQQPMNRFGKKIYFFVFFLSFIDHLSAQVPSLYFDKLTSQNGLSNNKVNCILQDARGFIWFGTDDGLNRYDGNNFTIFRNQPGNLFSISGNMIMDLLEDENGGLWIATADGGLTKYDHRLSSRKQFIQYKNLPADTNSIPVNILNALLEDQQGNLWIATSGAGVLKFDKKAQTFSKGSVGRNSTCVDLEFDEKGMIWVGRHGGGIMKINPLTNEYKMDIRYQNLYAKLPHSTVTALFADEEKNMWFGSWDKVLYRYNRKKDTEEVFQKDKNPWSFLNDEILCFGQDKMYNLWMGGRNSGLHIYNKKLNQFYNYQHDPSRDGTVADNQINCIYIDRSGVVWIGTKKGVSIHNPNTTAISADFYIQPRKVIERHYY